MRAINVRVSASPPVTWSVGKRIIVRTENGIMIGAVKSFNRQKIEINLDSGEFVTLASASRSILGEGINRKRKTAIPDEELVSWKRELCADVLLS